MSETKTLRCVVVVPNIDPGTTGDSWRVIWANGSEAEARKAAQDWALQHPGQEAHLFIRDDTAMAGLCVNWSKK